jgi:hypothetical protein
MSLIERIRTFIRRSPDRTRDTDTGRIDAMTSARQGDQFYGGEHGGGLPPNYLPTGVDEHRPRK